MAVAALLALVGTLALPFLSSSGRSFLNVFQGGGANGLAKGGGPRNCQGRHHGAGVAIRALAPGMELNKEDKANLDKSKMTKLKHLRNKISSIRQGTYEVEAPPGMQAGPLAARRMSVPVTGVEVEERSGMNVDYDVENPWGLPERAGADPVDEIDADPDVLKKVEDFDGDDPDPDFLRKVEDFDGDDPDPDFLQKVDYFDGEDAFDREASLTPAKEHAPARRGRAFAWVPDKDKPAPERREQKKLKTGPFAVRYESPDGEEEPWHYTAQLASAEEDDEGINEIVPTKPTFLLEGKDNSRRATQAPLTASGSTNEGRLAKCIVQRIVREKGKMMVQLTGVGAVAVKKMFKACVIAQEMLEQYEEFGSYGRAVKLKKEKEPVLRGRELVVVPINTRQNVVGESITPTMIFELTLQPPYARPDPEAELDMNQAPISIRGNTISKNLAQNLRRRIDKFDAMELLALGPHALMKGVTASALVKKYRYWEEEKKEDALHTIQAPAVGFVPRMKKVPGLRNPDETVQAYSLWCYNLMRTKKKRWYERWRKILT